MARKHNVSKRGRHTPSTYPRKVQERGRDVYPDYKLEDGKPSSAQRGGTGK